MTRKHDGSFQTFTGTVNLVDNDPTKSSVTAEIDVASIKTDEEKLTGHLKSADLLDVAKFPKATFTSTSIKPGGDKGATHTVTVIYPGMPDDLIKDDVLLKLHIHARRG